MSMAINSIGKLNGAPRPLSREHPFNFADCALQQIECKYNNCIVIYNEIGRLYEKLAAKNFATFLKKNIQNTAHEFVALVDQNSFNGVKENQLAIHIGTVGTESSENVWTQFPHDGYVIHLTQSEIIVRGSNAENTYYAVNRLINKHLHNNPDIITNAEAQTQYVEHCKVTRADYINHIENMPLVWSYDWSAPQWIFNFDRKLTDLVAHNGRPMAYAHRGDIESYPENSIEAVISAVRKGADMIELDCEISKDGILVLNHGEDMTATTDWAFKNGQIVNNVQLPTSKYIYDWTYEQLCQLNLRTGNGQYSSSDSEVSDYKIATLEEAIQVVNGKCFLSLDRLQYDLRTGAHLPEDMLGIHSPYWPSVFSMLKKHNAPRCILYSNIGLTREHVDALRTEVDAYFGLHTPSQFDRAGWHNSVVDYYTEFSLTTTEEFDAFYRAQLSREITLEKGKNTTASYLMVNRLSKCIDFIDREYSHT